MIVPLRGWEWLTDYAPDFGAILFLAVLNIVPAISLYVLGKISKKTPLAFWLAAAAGLAFLLWAHGTINLRASSTAAFGLIFIPIYAVIAAIVAWTVGLIAHLVVRPEYIRLQVARIVGVAVLALAAGIAVKDGLAVAKREARFPFIAVHETNFVKRIVYPCCSLGRVEVLALDNFDAEGGNEIAVFSNAGIALLKPDDYSIKSKFDFVREECNGCVHMYPYLAPDGKGSLVVASSDGLADIRGHLLWALKASGFTRLVPIQRRVPEPAFFAYDRGERVDLHDIDGKVLWTAKIAVSDIGVYVSPEGQSLPFAITGYGRSRRVNLYELNGSVQKEIPVPDRALNVEFLAWPTSGHLLVGSRNAMSVLDADGREIFTHIIQNTSFDPYHGPDGTAVRFDPSKEPYLAIVSHGSSGYARSVLLIFDPAGRLVWQEELNRLEAILTVPAGDAKGEVLLVGGMDGVIQYSLPGQEASNQGKANAAASVRKK